MSIEITDSLKAQIILSAVGAAGSGADDNTVSSQVSRIIGLMQDGSPAMAAFTYAEKRAENVVDTKKPFVGTVLYVDLEGHGSNGKNPSNRPIVFLQTEPSEHWRDGIEHFRLDRVDSHQGAQVKAQAAALTSLVGHRVAVTLRIEKGNGVNNRILAAYEDRGVDERFRDAQGGSTLSLAQGAAQIDWTHNFKPNRVEIAPRLVRLNRAAQPVG